MGGEMIEKMPPESRSSRVPDLWTSLAISIPRTKRRCCAIFRRASPTLCGAGRFVRWGAHVLPKRSPQQQRCSQTNS
jgi:hypothetical protein